MRSVTLKRQICHNSRKIQRDPDGNKQKKPTQPSKISGPGCLLFLVTHPFQSDSRSFSSLTYLFLDRAGTLFGRSGPGRAATPPCRAWPPDSDFPATLVGRRSIVRSLSSPHFQQIACRCHEFEECHTRLKKAGLFKTDMSI